MVKVWREHRQWVTNVHIQRGGLRELVSGSRNGEIKLWDLRMDNAISSTYATRDTLRTLSVHEHAPVFALYVPILQNIQIEATQLIKTRGTNRHEVKAFNMNGTQLSTFEPYSSFLNQSRSSPIACTAFHPHRTILACAALNDNHINFVSC